MNALRTRLKEALGISRRARSWDVLCVCAQPSHLLDPFCSAAYTHLMTVFRALRSETSELWNRWLEADEELRGGRPFGPRQIYLHYLRVLQMRELPGRRQLEMGLRIVHLCNTPPKEIGHHLREALRRHCLRQAEQRRTHLKGA